MHRIGTTDLAASQLIADLDRHTPRGVDMGEPLVILRGHLLIGLDGGLGVLRADHRGLHRVVVRPDGCEVAGWAYGARLYTRSVPALPDQEDWNAPHRH